MLYNMRMVQFHTTLTDAQHLELKTISNRSGVPMAALIRAAIHEYLSKIKSVRQDFGSARFGDSTAGAIPKSKLGAPKISSLRYRSPESPLMHTTEEPDDASNH